MNDFQYLEDDKARLGTHNYEGHAYFWSREYKHYLRGIDVNYREENQYWSEILAMRIRIHNELLKEGLPLNGESEKHLSIVLKNYSMAFSRIYVNRMRS